ncbi:MAG: ATP-dependent Clp protease proteolytic subunit [Clostridiales bacterium]|nr:ATP-dependent Clp protease proteolytic subunit [Clostridiales bacterium]
MSELFIPNVIVNRSGTEQLISPLSYELSNRRIYLCGEIEDMCATNIISQMHVLEDMSSDPITLFINSPGGSVSAGFAIIDAMEESPCIVSTCCYGLAASMAAVILASGDSGERLIGKHAEVMIHQPIGGVKGQASEISRVCDHILNTREKLARHLSEHTGKGMKTLLKDMDRDYWLSAVEAKKYGLVDRIIGKEIEDDA